MLKKAVAIALPMLKPDGTPKESGKPLEDVLEAVRWRMWLTEKLASWKSTSVVHSVDEESKDSSDDDSADPARLKEEDCPDDWIFHGWMAFVLYGPTAPKERRIDLLLLADPPTDGDKKKNGRDHKKQVKAEERKRERAYGGSERGLSVHDN